MSTASEDVQDLRVARTTPHADVFKAGRRAARLTRTVDGVRFAYLPEYLATATAPVATTLPLVAAPTLTRAGAVPAFFAGLLPEGPRLSDLAHAVGTSRDDELSLLLAVGSDLVGDVQVVPGGARPGRSTALMAVAQYSDVDFRAYRAGTGVVDRAGLPGVQDKASAGTGRHLLKFEPAQYPGLVEAEAFFLAESRRAGIATAGAEVVRDFAGRPGLLVERFDRPADGRRLAVEDGAQALGRYPADKYAVSAEEVVTALADLCPARPVALQTLFAQLVFAWLTGNGDVHAKNLSVLATPGGEWRVAPAYDLPSTLPYGDHTMALRLQGKESGLSRRTFLAFAKEIGLPERAAVRILDALLAATSDLYDRLVAAAPPFTVRQLNDLRRALRDRRRSLSG
ncbi:type II toxin-antitoxin system HipA family toxin [Spongisporangium articulatum]|uniref:Type II toxin-antitoxin system HipA family toxin n=1 Tax=Spongisporangium articulatum TaxID=3362603 RepID=A0ABW8AP44_9ACTN